MQCICALITTHASAAPHPASLAPHLLLTNRYDAGFEASSKAWLSVWSCAVLAGPVDVARVGVGAPSLGVTLDLLPHPFIGLAEAVQSCSVS